MIEKERKAGAVLLGKEREERKKGRAF